MEQYGNPPSILFVFKWLDFFSEYQKNGPIGVPSTVSVSMNEQDGNMNKGNIQCLGCYSMNKVNIQFRLLQYEHFGFIS